MQRGYRQPAHTQMQNGRIVVSKPQQDDFLKRLDRAEENDSQRGNSVNIHNWTQKSKQIAQLHMQNELAELAYKERTGILPQSSAPQRNAPPNGQMQGRGPPQQGPPPSAAQRQQLAMQQQQMRQPQGVPQQQMMTQQQQRQMQMQQQQQMQMQMQQQQQMQMPRQQQQQMQQRQLGGAAGAMGGQARGGTPGGRGYQQQQPQHVQRMQAFDQWDDRVPAHLRAGGQVMTSSQAAAQRRGNNSSIVFG